MPATQGGSRQQVEEDEELEHQRRAADQLDVAGQHRPQRPRPVQPAERRSTARAPSPAASSVTESTIVTSAASSSSDRYCRRSAQPARVRPAGDAWSGARSQPASSFWASVQMPYFS